eukprot:Amastigsp_a841762_12.p4 type:complete len:144 gc:universal Amastigsp_a841762_12:443-12(-)
MRRPRARLRGRWGAQDCRLARRPVSGRHSPRHPHSADVGLGLADRRQQPGFCACARVREDRCRGARGGFTESQCKGGDVDLDGVMRVELGRLARVRSRVAPVRLGQPVRSVRSDRRGASAHRPPRRALLQSLLQRVRGHWQRR